MNAKGVVQSFAMNTQAEKIVVRIPPSPTGMMHLGTARTALVNYLFAKKHSGKVILRMEDTDRERSKSEFADDIVDGLSWLGISHDEMYKQSERTDIYTKYLKQLIDDGHAYVSHEQKKDGEGEVDVVRFKNPNKEVTFTDLVRGDITFDTTDLGDFVIAKSLTEPLYHLAVVVDDMEMNITHVIRGEDHISNTPRQILVAEALGASLPQYAHIPLILAPDKSKLSKRHGAVAVTEYRNQGFLPEALINFLALIGWNPGTDQELFSLEELIEAFTLEKVQKGGAVFNIEKLRWFNREYIQKLPEATVTEEIRKYFAKFEPSDEILALLTPVILERVELFSDIGKQVEEGEFDYYFSAPEVDSNKLVWKDDDPANTRRHLETVFGLIEDVTPWDKESIKEALWPYATEAGKGSVLWPMRFALTGRDKSPDPFTVAHILGKEETQSRIQAAISLVS